MVRRTPVRGAMSYSVIELGGVRYAVVPEAALAALCRRAGVAAQARPEAPCAETARLEGLEGAGLAQRLAERRKRAGLSQGELARQAGVRVETVNRIERGRVTPDFATIRKLVEAMSHVEAAAGMAATG